MPPGTYYTDSPSSYVTSSFYSSRRAAATPFRDRAHSLPREVVYTPPSRSYSMERSYASDSHYTDFDCKVMAYSANLNLMDEARQSVSRARDIRSSVRHGFDYPSGSFSSKYDYYHGNKHGDDPLLYPCSSWPEVYNRIVYNKTVPRPILPSDMYLDRLNREVLGTWKHYNLSGETLNARNTRAKSPLVSRELDRYYETKKRSNYIGEVSMGGACDFRYYNYRKVPYFGGSDNYAYMKQTGFRKRNGF